MVRHCTQGIGQALCYWILTNSGQVIARTTVQPLSNEELSTQSITDLIKAFDHQTAAKLGDNFGPQEDYSGNPYLQDIDDGTFEPFEPEATMPEADAFDIDAYLQAAVQLPKLEGYRMATVLRRKHDKDGNPIGYASTNPMLDT